MLPEIYALVIFVHLLNEIIDTSFLSDHQKIFCTWFYAYVTYRKSKNIGQLSWAICWKPVHKEPVQNEVLLTTRNALMNTAGIHPG